VRHWQGTKIGDRQRRHESDADKEKVLLDLAGLCEECLPLINLL
jgi:hypothetical protein